jgi:hypothetical protein
MEDDLTALEAHLSVQRRIEARAYALWLASGCGAGAALANWVEAERQIMAEYFRRGVQASAGAQRRPCGATDRTRARRHQTRSSFHLSPRIVPARQQAKDL